MAIACIESGPVNRSLCGDERGSKDYRGSRKTILNQTSIQQPLRESKDGRKKKSFSELSPGKKRLFALLGAAGVVIIFASASEMLFSPASKDKAPKNDVQRNVLTDTNTRQLGIDGLSASVQRMRREITELSNSLGKYMESQEAQQKNRNLELDKELASIKKIFAK